MEERERLRGNQTSCASSELGPLSRSASSGQDLSVLPRGMPDLVKAFVSFHVASEHMVGTDYCSMIVEAVEDRDEVGKQLSPTELTRAKRLAADWAPKHAGDLQDIRTQYDIAKAYRYGTELFQNLSLAVKWTLEAAKHGNVAAQYDLGMVYSSGDGVQRDLVAAHVWFSLVESYDFPPKTERAKFYSHSRGASGRT